MNDSPAPLLTVVVNLRFESYDVYIGRPSIFGNPFYIGRDGTRTEVLAKYRRWLAKADSPQAQRIIEAIKSGQLDNKRLGCFCSPLPCHGDVLLDLVLSRVKKGE